ncbi:erythromycin esterase [Pedobacter terrae]|uniref:Erythromycin esterase n=1 Tax=Pedobacter terrae TaxID=405671 RepID=A0A1G8CK65_9SPHI|nr:erythromycin esterase family protein [Pedobacter terrae]SDH45623.1 erythromycin esterase [Pedobacter terrae]
MSSSLVLIRLLCIHLIILSFGSTLNAQNKVESYTKELNLLIKPIATDGDGQITQTGVPSSILDDKYIIGLGESTHGTKEFNLYRFALIKELILKQNVKMVVMETDYCYSKTLNNYLISDSNDSLIKYITKTGLYGIYRTQEVFEMLNWIKQYNLTKDKKDRVQFLGLDMQDPFILSDQILVEFPDLKSMNSLIYDQLISFKDLFKDGNSFKMSSTNKRKYQDMADEIQKLVMSRKAINSVELNTLSRLLRQTIDLQGTFGTFKNYFSAYNNIRDKYMADNVLAFHQQLSKDDKLVVWAHNTHIAHATLDGAKRMGAYFKDKLKDKYFAIGGAFDEGSVRIYDFGASNMYKNFDYPTSQNKYSIEYILKECKYPNFYFTTSDILKNKELQSWVEDYKYTRVIGATYHKDPAKDYSKVAFAECFDGMYFFKIAHGAENVRQTP